MTELKPAVTFEAKEKNTKEVCAYCFNTSFFCTVPLVYLTSLVV